MRPGTGASREQTAAMSASGRPSARSAPITASRLAALYSPITALCSATHPLPSCTSNTKPWVS
jgi:hypothetical protein